MANTHYIDTARQFEGAIRFLEIAPKRNRDGSQQEDNDGNPKFTAQVMVTEKDTGRREILKVTVIGDGKAVPGSGVPEMASVTLAGLRAGVWVDDNGNRNFFYQADSIASGIAPAAAPVARAS